MICDCEEFRLGMEWINSCERVAYNHGMRYNLSFYMKYCAWGGKELKEESSNSDAKTGARK